MLGQNVSSYPDAPKRMLELGCEIGSHSWDHTQLTTIDLDAVAKQFSDTDDALIQACGQAASVARAPYGDGNSDIYNTVNKPFFMWSLDTEDWKLLDADADYSAVMNGKDSVKIVTIEVARILKIFCQCLTSGSRKSQPFA